MLNYPQNQKFNQPFLRRVIKKSNYGSGPVPHRAWLWCGAQQTISWILDIIFPKVCLGCGKFTVAGDFDYVCKKCFGGISLKNTLECIGCKRQTQLGLTCMSCKKENKIDQLLIAAELSDPVVEKMLKAYKYKFIPEMIKPLSVIAKKGIKKLLSKKFNLFDDSPVIMPVPLHKKRLNWRGFNQAQLLAKDISDVFLVSYSDNILVRTSYYKNQAGIKAKESRIENIKNNFIVSDNGAIRGKIVILVDDICTTGATLNECTRVLKKSGAKRVIGFVIARGQFKRN